MFLQTEQTVTSTHTVIKQNSLSLLINYYLMITQRKTTTKLHTRQLNIFLKLLFQTTLILRYSDVVIFQISEAYLLHDLLFLPISTKIN